METEDASGARGWGEREVRRGFILCYFQLLTYWRSHAI